MTRILNRLALMTTVAAAAVVAVPGLAEAATRYVAPSGGGGACSSGAPCGSFDAAYRAASPGDVIEVAGGGYGEQNVPSLGRGNPAIEFRPASGASVTVAGLNVRADHVVLRGMRSSDQLDVAASETDPVVDVHLVNMHTKTHFINNAQGFVWTGGSIGPSFNDKASMVGGHPASRNLTYDDVYWHDATRNAQDVHMECFYVASVQGLTIRNSRFHNCAVFDILFTRLGDDPSPSNILVENTVFEASKDVGSANGYYVLATHEVVDINGFVLRNNIFELPFQVMGTVSNARAVGNIGILANCQPGVSYSHNVFAAGRCSGSDKIAPGAFSQFVNRAAGDWRLEPGAAAIDAGDPGDHPALDAQGYSRSVGQAPDAGPYEFGAGPPTGSGGGQTGGQRRATRSKVRVVKVLNGRTLRVRGKHGKRFRVRLLGVRLPSARCGGRGATARLRVLAPKGRNVVMITDAKTRARDAQGRRLAYVARSRLDIGKALLAAGWARFDRSAGPLTRGPSYRAVVHRAHVRKLGLWGC
jgi:endonuclease YncB( thermonuclease family)